MKSINLIALLVVSAVLYSNETTSDIFETKKRAFSQTADSKIDNYNSKKAVKDEEFNNALKTSWEEFEARIEDFAMGPKPVDTPNIEPREFSPEDKSPVNIELSPEKVLPKAKVRDYSYISDYREIEVDYFNQKIFFKIPKIGTIRVKEVNNDEFSRGWESLSWAEYIPLLTQIENSINRYNLNNWGLYSLTRSISEEVYRDNNTRVLLQVFLLTNLGYDCKIGYSGKRAFTLLPSSNPLYGKTYLTIDGKKYFVIENSLIRLKTINTYRASYNGAKKSFDFTMDSLPQLNEELVNKSLTFIYSGTKHSVNVVYNKTLVEYLKDYPQTHYENYFNSSLSNSSRESILNGLKPILDGKSQSEAVNILLHFTQKAFKYKTDQEQFKREKPLFPEEVLHYSYSDCEDRAVLFSYLVRELLSLKVLGLKYPSHMAAAVYLETPVGDVVTYKNRLFTVADPTYINANIGNSMPEFKNIKPDIIGVD